ncbi:unnamed protein product [Periconia digitata]|uniref:P-loop containing nucleoside triphosphate hydrolase protein n=1 Tax=Periconia digitata TaxID=1303443 RepID=A0A9W4U401_9PLEO|nr:unnamed protein product [Periconia digitata]
MESQKIPSQGDDADMTVSHGSGKETYRLRSYQAEMVAESLKMNIIVVMDTGSGKTHIALARTAAELETCDPTNLVWFLSPTLALCEQQSNVFESLLPAFKVQDLANSKGIEHWSDQRTWDGILEHVRIAVSTPQILLDALYHGFVQMKRLALIIFDEAHHCTQNHPANKILQNFYIPLSRNKHASGQLPRILGLSASPVMKAKATGVDLQNIERNMNATAKTPKVTRSDLLRFVHRPELHRVDYQLMTSSLPPFLIALQNEYATYDIEKDPYVIDLLTKHHQGHNTEKQLKKVFHTHKTYCLDQLKTLLSKTVATYEELGASIAEWYLRRCISDFDRMWRMDHELSGLNQEKQHLATIFQRLPLAKDGWSPGDIINSLSPKVEALIDVLVEETHPELTGLIFVEQRVWVAALLEVLTIHPKIQGKLTSATFMGSSQSTKRKTYIANAPEPRNQRETLDSFRAGETNLILATSVLEEGIDVSSCHLVICFEQPKNLKSFIQRRGRARKQQSKYYIFVPHDPRSMKSVGKWVSMEEEMKKAYLDDKRHIEAATERELIEETSDRVYYIESTEALLNFDNASQHLHHFCSTVTSKEYVDTRPQFDVNEVAGSGISATVTLPLSVDAAVRSAKSLQYWQTERMAMKDACFQAYVNLHKAGLVNDNLLPDKEEADDEAESFQIPDNTPALVEVMCALNPWLEAINHVHRPVVLYRTLLEIRVPHKTPHYMQLLTPIELPKIPDLNLHWNETTQCSIAYTTLGCTSVSEEYISALCDNTQKILQTVFHSRMRTGLKDFLWLLAPSDSSGTPSSLDELVAWNRITDGAQLAPEKIQQGDVGVSEWGVLSLQNDGRRFLPHRILPSTQDTTESIVQGIRLPKRRDFLHPMVGQGQQNDAYSAVEDFVGAESLVVSNLPAKYTVFALFTPSIMHTTEIYMIADTLRTSLLKSIQLPPDQLPLILRALTASSTGEQSNYQRLEFLGDCILKYVASVHLMAEYLNAPESYLTGKKGKIVSNGFAARSAIAIGLDRFILTKRFTGAKWGPPYISDLLQKQEEKRTLSSKVLADVVESLIGASYVFGGFPTAFACIQSLLPSESWTPLAEANMKLHDAVPSGITITSLANLEQMVGYTFNKKILLLQALTHPDYHGPIESGTYERLEFLGDAVLDYTISTRLHAHNPPLSHDKMHGIRTAMANASFLAFRMFETHVPTPPTTSSSSSSSSPSRPLTLAHHLRFTSPLISAALSASYTSHASVRPAILYALTHSKKFPWHLLSLTDAPKFLSDVVESVIGAIYVDSGGDIDACETFVRRLGILEALERILDKGVDCLHPKERVGHLAGERDVRYVRVVGGDKKEEGKRDGDASGDAGGRYRVQVKIGGVDVGDVVEGVKRLNAETMAAWRAIGILEAAGDGGGGGGQSKRAREDDEEEEEVGDGGVEEWFDAEEDLGQDAMS